MGFLDCRPFPAAEPDGHELLDAVIKAFPKSPAVEAYVQTAGLPMARFKWMLSMEDVWPDVLSVAADLGKLRVLVDAIAKDLGDEAYPVFARLLAEPQPTPGMDADAYGINMLGGGRNRLAFIDRDDLRTYLRDLAQEDKDRVLVVTGPAQSGKSHTWHLIQHIGGCVVGIQPGLIDLTRWTGQPAGPYDIMELVVNALALTDLPPCEPHAHPDNQERKLLAWFTGRISRQPEPSWLVFDGVEHAHLTEAGTRLVNDIADAARNNQAGKLRVALLAGSPPSADEYNMVHEAIQPVGVSELRRFFVGAARQAGEDIDAAALDALLDKLFDGVEPADPLCLAKIGPRAMRLAQQTFVV